MEAKEKVRKEETERMQKFDGYNEDTLKSLGSHLGNLGLNESRKKIADRFKDREKRTTAAGLKAVQDEKEKVGDNHPTFDSFANPQALMRYCEFLYDRMQLGLERMRVTLQDTIESHYENSDELASLVVERRGREEEVVNWSFVLKYLLSTNSKLRMQLKGRSNLVGLLDEGGGGDEEATTTTTTGENTSTINKHEKAKSTTSAAAKLKKPMTPESAKKIVPNKQVANALIAKVSKMSQKEINALPKEVRDNVNRLREELGRKKQANNSFEEYDEEEESSDDDDEHFSQI